MSARLIRDTELRLARLTGREREVCELLARGLVTSQIAFELGTCENTVKSHRGRVMHKLEVDSIAALARLVRLSAQGTAAFLISNRP